MKSLIRPPAIALIALAASLSVASIAVAKEAEVPLKVHIAAFDHAIEKGSPAIANENVVYYDGETIPSERITCDGKAKANTAPTNPKTVANSTTNGLSPGDNPSGNTTIARTADLKRLEIDIGAIAKNTTVNPATNDFKIATNTANANSPNVKNTGTATLNDHKIVANNTGRANAPNPALTAGITIAAVPRRVPQHLIC